VYCESGRTTCLTLERQVFVPPERVLRDLQFHFAEHPPGDTEILTLSSAGEPTLYAALGELLERIKKSHPDLPLAVLTNGSLLWDPSVRKDLRWADLVVPSLDAVSSPVFRKVNRPHKDLTVESVLEGLRAFRKEYRGRFNLEVLLVAQVNDQPAELKRIARVVKVLNPDSVELNTVVRPPAFPGVAGLSQAAMEEARSYFPLSRTHVIGAFRETGVARPEDHLEQRILDVVGRRPCTLIEMAHSLSVAVPQMELTLQRLLESHLLETHSYGDALYYCLAMRGHQRNRCT
jgi:wyosine [tRNA(Phe)-imidazoG37] synthetase (radical SAM superfamily)